MNGSNECDKGMIVLGKRNVAIQEWLVTNATLNWAEPESLTQVVKTSPNFEGETIRDLISQLNWNTWYNTTWLLAHFSSLILFIAIFLTFSLFGVWGKCSGCFCVL